MNKNEYVLPRLIRLRDISHYLGMEKKFLITVSYILSIQKRGDQFSTGVDNKTWHPNKWGIT